MTRIGSGAIGTAQADGSGAWTLPYAGPALPPGAYAFTATATDVAGNTSAASAEIAVDTSIATPTIVSISDDTGASASDGITADNTIVLSGLATAGHTISIVRSGPGGSLVIGSTIAGGTGQWTFDHTGTTLTDGTYAFQASATNGSGGSGVSPSSPAFLVTIDTVAPTVLSVNRENPTAAIDQRGERDVPRQAQ